MLIHLMQEVRLKPQKVFLNKMVFTMNMNEWYEEIKNSKTKKAMPILSFPSTQLLNITVRELINSSDNQSRGMYEVAKRTPKALASVSLMDLSVEAECFGSTIVISDHEVPTVKGAIVTTLEEAEALEVPKVGACRTGIYVEAIKKAKELIKDRPVLAGIIGPFSLAGRLVDVTEALIDCYTEPEMMHEVLKKCTSFLKEYAKAYKSVGANGIVIAEPLAGLLSPDLMEEFSEPYVKELIDEVQDENFIVVYHNCGNTVIKTIDSILRVGAKIYHFGNAIDMSEMLKHVPSDVVVMGNINPAKEFRNGTPESIRKATLELMEKCCSYNNFVISSGCDIPPLSKWENIDAFFDAVDEFYSR